MFGAIGGTEVSVSPKNVQTMLKSLPKHECAYCGSKKTHISGIDFELSDHSNYLTFTIICHDCGNEDGPSISHEHLKSLLRCLY